MRHGRASRALPLGRRVARRARQELSLLLLVLLVTSALWAFALLADAVVEGETPAFDRAVLLAMRTPGDPAAPWGPAGSRVVHSMLYFVSKTSDECC
jgi:hypothetical protein